jgi:predicted branched-subunit amino acid permease
MKLAGKVALLLEESGNRARYSLSFAKEEAFVVASARIRPEIEEVFGSNYIFSNDVQAYWTWQGAGE